MINLPNIIFSLVMGLLMSLSITVVTTFVHNGLSADFFWIWLDAWLVVYPIAIICILIHKPLSSKLTEKIVEKIKSSE